MGGDTDKESNARRYKRERKPAKAFPELVMHNDETRTLVMEEIKSETLDSLVRKFELVRWPLIENFLNPVVMLHDTISMKNYLADLEKNGTPMPRPDTEYYVQKFLRYVKELSDKPITKEIEEEIREVYGKLLDKYVTCDELLTIIQEDGYPWHCTEECLIDAGMMRQGSRAFHLGCLMGFHDVFIKFRNPWWSIMSLVSVYLAKRRWALKDKGEEVTPINTQLLLNGTIFGAIHNNMRIAARMREEKRKEEKEKKEFEEKHPDRESYVANITVKMTIAGKKMEIEMPVYVTIENGEQIIDKEDVRRKINNVEMMVKSGRLKNASGKVKIEAHPHHNHERVKEIGDVHKYTEEILKTVERQVNCLASLDENGVKLKKLLDKLGITGKVEEDQDSEVHIDLITSRIPPSRVQPLFDDIMKNGTEIKKYKVRRICKNDPNGGLVCFKLTAKSPDKNVFKELRERCFVNSRIEGLRTEEGIQMRKMKLGNSFILVPDKGSESENYKNFDELVASGELRMVDVRRVKSKEKKKQKS